MLHVAMVLGGGDVQLLADCERGVIEPVGELYAVPEVRKAF